MCYQVLIWKIDDIINFNIYHQPLKQWLTGEKEEKTEIQKSEYVENKKSFVDEIKNIQKGLSFSEK